MRLELNISVKTAERHRTQLTDRLEVHDFANLVRLAIKVGLVAVAFLDVWQGYRVRQMVESIGVPYGSRTRVAAVKGKRPIVIQRNFAAWIALDRT